MNTFIFEVANVYLVFFPLIPKAKQGSLFYFSTMHLFEPMFFGQYNIFSFYNFIGVASVSFCVKVK